MAPNLRRLATRTLSLFEPLAAENHSRMAGRSKEKKESEALLAALREIGIISPALERLAGRDALQKDPAVVRAWWWFSLTQSWIRNPQGLVIRRLEDNHEAPSAFLELAHQWPAVTREDKLEMRQLLWSSWTPEQMAAAFHSRYPSMTASVFAAFEDLCRTAPEELGLGG